MKRKVRMKRFKIGFSLLMSFVLVFSFFNYGLTAKQQPVKAAVDISTTNYSTWQAATLSEARDSVNKLLTSAKGSDSTRPYKENATWSEGSLAALDKAYKASVAVSTTNDVSANLSREQLIQTVQGLEPIGTKNNAYYTSLNNYPNENGVYDLEYTLTNIGLEQGEKIDVMFILDWSGSMKTQMVGPNMDTGTKNPRDASMYHGQKMVESFAEKIVESNADARIRLIAHNQSVNNQEDKTWGIVNGGYGYTYRYGIQKNTGDSGFFTVDQNKDYKAKIKETYSVSPEYQQDGIPWMIPVAQQLFEGPTGTYAVLKNDPIRENAKPVLIVLSDFQLGIGSDGKISAANLNAAKNTYITNLNKYYSGIENTDQVPVYISVPYYNTIGAPNSGVGTVAATTEPVPETLNADRISKGWGLVPITNDNLSTAEIRLADAIDLGMGYLPWTSTLDTDAFKFVDYSSSTATLKSLQSKQLVFEGLGDSTGRFKLNVDSTKYNNPKKGSMAQATTSAVVKTDEESIDFNPTSKLFLPITDAAVELYTYNGSGSETTASNYSLADTIVSNNYNSFSGTNYSKKSGLLTSIDYLDNGKKTLTKQNALDALKEGLGDAEYSKLDFTQGNSLTSESLTVQFDSSKNVYKVYAKAAETDGTIIIRYLENNAAGKVIKAEDTKTGPIDADADITPPTISGYTYSTSNSEPLASVKYEKGTKVVELYYTENPKVSTMKVKYINGFTQTEIISERTITGTDGESPTEEELAKDAVGENFVLTGISPPNPKFGTDSEVLLTYMPIGHITIEYWDSDTNSKITSVTNEVLKGVSGTDVDYTQKEIAGYAFDKDRSDTVPSKFTEGSVTVRQYYSKVYTVTIEYWDSGTNSKITTEANTVITGKKDATLSYSPKEIDGYIYDSVRSDTVPTTITGDATYRAYYNKAGAVTIEYWSSDTNQKIAGQSDEVLKGVLDTKATITPKVISGYKFDASRSDSLDNVTYKTGSNTIRLYYTQYVNLTVIFEKISPRQELGKVVVKAKIGETVHLENDFTEVKSKLAELENAYRLYERPADYAAYKVPTDDATVTYLFDGTLFLSSAPSLLEFGSGHEIMQLGEYESERPDYDKPLTVTDTRADLTNWKISVKLTEDMHSRKKPSFILKDVLYYKEGTKMTPVTSGGPIDILTSKHSERGDYDVSETEWENKSNGFIFKLSQNQYREIDDYDGTIQFTLTEAK